MTGACPIKMSWILHVLLWFLITLNFSNFYLVSRIIVKLFHSSILGCIITVQWTHIFIRVSVQMSCECGQKKSAIANAPSIFLLLLCRCILFYSKHFIFYLFKKFLKYTSVLFFFSWFQQSVHLPICH